MAASSLPFFGEWMRLSRCLSVPEAADVLNIVPGTLRMWIRKGTGPKVTRLNGHVTIRDDHLQEFINSCGENDAEFAVETEAVA